MRSPPILVSRAERALRAPAIRPPISQELCRPHRQSACRPAGFWNRGLKPIDVERRLALTKITNGFLGPRYFRHTSSRSRRPPACPAWGWVTCPTGQLYVSNEYLNMPARHARGTRTAGDRPLPLDGSLINRMAVALLRRGRGHVANAEGLG